MEMNEDNVGTENNFFRSAIDHAQSRRNFRVDALSEYLFPERPQTNKQKKILILIQTKRGVTTYEILQRNAIIYALFSHLMMCHNPADLV